MKKYFPLFFTVVVSAEPLSIESILYGAWMSYEGATLKKRGHVEGLYAAVDSYTNRLEFSIERSRYLYREEMKDLRQTDMTLIYTHFDGDHTGYRIGIHKIRCNDGYTDKGFTGILGIGWYTPETYDFGMDLYHTEYSEAIPSTLEVWQFHPHLGYLYESFYIEGEYDYIDIRKARRYGLDGESHSVGIGFTYRAESWKITASGWKGSRIYAVDDGGFTVFNLPEKYRGGIRLSGRYFVDTTTSIGLRYDRSRFEERGDARSETLALLFRYRF
ncbi:hypothetical protein [Hydrogenimonas sp.]